MSSLLPPYSDLGELGEGTAPDVVARAATRLDGDRTWRAISVGALAGLLLLGTLVLLLSMTGPRTTAAPARPASDAPPGGAPTVPRGTPLSEAPTVGALAPRFTLPGLDGQPVSLQDFRGHPVWLNFWASWCGPCRAEMPDMKRLYAQYKDQGLVLLGVDLGESQGTVAGFITPNEYNWTFLLDTNQSVGQRYYIGGIPTHAFIDRNGVIRRYVVSGLTPTTMESYLTEILPK